MAAAPAIVFGDGEIYQLQEHLKKLGATRALIIYDANVKSLVGPILEHLEGFVFDTFDRIVPESPDHAVQDLRDHARSFGADAYVAIGGGSTMDTARAAMLLSNTDEPVDHFFDQPYTGEVPQASFICVPTTAGTGAEMSAAGPILNTKTNVKKGLMLPFRQADMVILDPEMTKTLPPFVAYCCAMDALAHSMEAMTGLRRNAMTDMICGQAVEYIWKYLPRVMEDPTDVEARGHLILASNLAIGCQNIRQLGHAVCQPVGGKLHLSHGYSCAAVIPAATNAYSGIEETKEAWAYVAKRMGIEGGEDPARAIAEAVAASNKKYGIQTLEEKGYSWEEVLSCTEEILKDQRLLPNVPIPVTEELIRNTLKEMYYGI